jgi:hypothetical protein
MQFGPGTGGARGAEGVAAHRRRLAVPARQAARERSSDTNAASTGASAASASVLTPVSNSGVAFGPHNPGHPNCSGWQPERWNLNGNNTITAVYNNQNYYCTVTFVQNGNCLTGTLNDPNIPSPLPTSGPIFGTIRGNAVTFSFAYPASMTVQGTRTYTGTINRRGAVSGTWSDGGHRALHRTWSLGTKANRACPRFWWWNPRHESFVRSH